MMTGNGPIEEKEEESQEELQKWNKEEWLMLMNL